MFRYVFVLMLVNIYSRSMGLPVGVPSPSPINNGTLLQPLITLSAKCANPFIVEQIRSKNTACAIGSMPIGKPQLRCLMFYDTSSRLCDLKTSFTAQEMGKLNEQGDLVTLCDGASTWTANNLPEYPLYKSMVEKSFKTPTICMQLCESEEFGSLDSNFYCKYFKWGSQLLNKQIATGISGDFVETLPSAAGALSEQANVAPSKNVVPSANPTAESVISEPSEIKNDKHNLGNIAGNAVSPTTLIIKPSNKTGLTDTSAKDEVNKSNLKPKSPLVVQSNPDVTLNSLMQKQATVEGKHTPLNKVTNDKGVEKDNKLVSDEVNNSIDKPVIDEIDTGTPLKTQAQEMLDVPKDLGDPDMDIEKPKNAEMDDYQDSEEGKESLAQGGEGGDDPAFDDVDVKLDSPQGKNAATAVQKPTFKGEREFFPNTFQESFDDDDDHFFSFFLPAVISVVLVYVLYHNRNKVSKVFLGLVVEGRQPGRRRNSRGHAYKRLDTLEQAMSTNANAPPSKIIY